jgi:hypothetical protein
MHQAFVRIHETCTAIGSTIVNKKSQKAECLAKIFKNYDLFEPTEPHK